MNWFGTLAAGETEVSPLFGLLTFALVGVVLVSLVLFRFRQSLLVGYFLCGVILSNSGMLEWIKAEPDDLNRLAEIGIVLLLFTLGVGFSVEEMKHLRRVALVAGGWQVALVTLVAGAIAMMFGLGAPAALAVGVAVALSSTAVSIKAFQDLGLAEGPGARAALGVAIFQDLLVILFMIVLPPLLGEGEGSMAAGLGLAIVKGGLFLVACLVLSRFGIPQLLHAVARTRSRELFTVAVVSLCAAVAFGAVQLQLSAALGAFAAGLVVSESIYSHRVLSDILPFKDLFLTIFFVSVGLLIDLGEVAQHWVLIVGATLGILVVKFCAAFFAARQLGVGLRSCLLAGAALASTGEFSLVLLERITSFNVLNAQAEQILLASTAIGMGLVPTLMRLAERVAPVFERKGWLARKSEVVNELTPEGELEVLEDHVIICGFGPVGRNLHRALEKCGIPLLVLELNADTVKELRKTGVRAVFADARQAESLEMARIEQARSVAFTFPDAEAAIAGMRLAREQNPQVLVYARAKFSTEAERLAEAGVDHVFHDERESGQAMIKAVVACYTPEEVFEELTW